MDVQLSFEFRAHHRRLAVAAATSVVRITDVQSDRFALYVHEAPNKDGVHTTETVNYVVLEAGTREVAGGKRLHVGTLTTNATVGVRVSNVWAQVTFSETFSSAPVVLSQVQSDDDPHWVKTRQRYVGASGFQVALEEEEASSTSHGTETIGWLAIEAGHEDVERSSLPHSLCLSAAGQAAPKGYALDRAKGCALDRSLRCFGAAPLEVPRARQAGLRFGPDCVKTHLILREWGDVVSRHEESRPVSYSPPEQGTKWDTCPISLTFSGFSRSLGRGTLPGCKHGGEAHCPTASTPRSTA